jgi:hypothetical protein
MGNICMKNKPNGGIESYKTLIIPNASSFNKDNIDKQFNIDINLIYSKYESLKDDFGVINEYRNALDNNNWNNVLYKINILIKNYKNFIEYYEFMDELYNSHGYNCDYFKSLTGLAKNKINKWNKIKENVIPIYSNNTPTKEELKKYPFATLHYVNGKNRVIKTSGEKYICFSDMSICYEYPVDYLYTVVNENNKENFHKFKSYCDKNIDNTEFPIRQVNYPSHSVSEIYFKPEFIDDDPKKHIQHLLDQYQLKFDYDLLITCC